MNTSLILIILIFIIRVEYTAIYITLGVIHQRGLSKNWLYGHPLSNIVDTPPRPTSFVWKTPPHPYCAQKNVRNAKYIAIRTSVDGEGGVLNSDTDIDIAWHPPPSFDQTSLTDGLLLENCLFNDKLEFVVLKCIHN